jgi:hypothetical protein
LGITELCHKLEADPAAATAGGEAIGGRHWQALSLFAIGITNMCRIGFFNSSFPSATYTVCPPALYGDSGSFGNAGPGCIIGSAFRLLVDDKTTRLRATAKKEDSNHDHRRNKNRDNDCNQGTCNPMGRSSVERRCHRKHRSGTPGLDVVTQSGHKVDAAI